MHRPHAGLRGPGLHDRARSFRKIPPQSTGYAARGAGPWPNQMAQPTPGAGAPPPMHIGPLYPERPLRFQWFLKPDLGQRQPPETPEPPRVMATSSLQGIRWPSPRPSYAPAPLSASITRRTSDVGRNRDAACCHCHDRPPPRRPKCATGRRRNATRRKPMNQPAPPFAPEPHAPPHQAPKGRHPGSHGRKPVDQTPTHPKAPSGATPPHHKPATT